jgi:hypothetical protein
MRKRKKKKEKGRSNSRMENYEKRNSIKTTYGKEGKLK